jgi:transcriptional regulator with GAF, ATPase, and Fis domain
MLEQIVLMAQDSAITPAELLLPALPPPDATGPMAPPATSDALNLEGMERQFLVTALGKSDWNVTQAARMLGLSRDALRYRMEKYSIKSRSQ